MEKLFAFDSFKNGIFDFEIIENFDGGSLVVKSLVCRGHEPCIIRLKKLDEGVYMFDYMLNNNGEYYWFSDKRYFLSKEACISDYYSKRKLEFLSYIEESKNSIKDLKEKIDYFEDKIKNLGVVKSVKKDIQIEDKLYCYDKLGNVKSI